METALLNNELNFSYPEGFHVMDQAELSAYNFYAAAPGWCINDPDRHIMVSVAWKQAPGLFAKMLKVKDVASMVWRNLSPGPREAKRLRDSAISTKCRKPR